MFQQIPTLGFCFTLCVLSLIATTEATYQPRCCTGSTLIYGICVCNRGYHPDSGHRCVERPAFQFARTSYTVKESVGSVKLQVDRIPGGGLFKVIVYWSATALTARFGSDYGLASGSVTFEAGEKWKSIQIPIKNDQIPERTEQFKVTLTSASSGGEIGPRRVTTVTIEDDDKIATFQFARTSYTVKESVGSVKLQVDRIPGGGLHKVIVYWSATALTARFGSDYGLASGSVTFEAGIKWKSIQIPIKNDQIPERTEQFKVTLTSARPGGAIGPRRVTTVTIEDDDKIAKFQFARTSYTVKESVGSVKLQVDRIPGGGLHQVTVYWRTTDLTARLNSDFKGRSGTIVFGVNENWKNIVIPIVNDKFYEKTEQFKVTLTSARPAGGIGPRSETRVIIQDDDKPCGGICWKYQNSYCNTNTNRCVCKANFRGDPYHGGCKCSGGGGY